MVKKVVYYEASDGEKFTEKNEARRHEIRLNGKIFASEKEMWEYFKDKDKLFVLLQSPDSSPYSVKESYSLLEDAVNNLAVEYPDVYIEHKNGLRKMFLFDFMWKQLRPYVVIRHFRMSTPHADNYTDEHIMQVYQFAERESYGQDEESYMFDALIALVDSLNE